MINPEQALQKLLEGNERFRLEKQAGFHLDQVRRAELAKQQKPFAVIVCCSDSRVPPELIFDQGLGELFVVRNAGQIVDDIALGSIEYAVNQLGARLIFVLGHDDCGAIKAAVSSSQVPGHLAAVITAVEPAVVRARTEAGDLTINAIGQNVDLIIEKIREAKPILKEAIETKKVEISGGVYHIKSGNVELRR